VLISFMLLDKRGLDANACPAYRGVERGQGESSTAKLTDSCGSANVLRLSLHLSRANKDVPSILLVYTIG
jgi:hypothetical protein